MSGFGDRAAGPAQKPNIIAILGSMVHDFQKNGVLAYEMPNDATAAAKWFMGRMEPQGRFEGMSLKAGKNGEEFFEFPYLDRMLYLLNRYYHQPDSFQAIIIGCCDEGVFWRGEDIDHFYNNENSVYNEVIKMREVGGEGYQKGAVNLLKNLEIGNRKGPDEESEPSIEL